MCILQDFIYPDRPAPALVIMLPGALQQPEDFVRFGFVEEVRKRRLPIDLAMVDLDLSYITDITGKNSLQSIRDGVVLPAQGKNYREIWFGGISIGGLIALSYADSFVSDVNGLCLLSPYPGNRILTGEIANAGGLAHWQCSRSDDAERRVWQWLKTFKAKTSPPEIYLGYGLDDRFASGQRLMAEAVGVDCVDTVAGGHEWPVWQQLWINFLTRTASHFDRLASDANR